MRKIARIASIVPNKNQNCKNTLFLCFGKFFSVGLGNLCDVEFRLDKEQADAGDADYGSEDFAEGYLLMEEQGCGGDDEDGC